MSNRSIAAALAVVLGSLITACSAAGPRVTAVGESPTPAGTVTIPTDSGKVAVPAGTGATMGSGSGTTSGPGEKENQRGNTPPGMSRDGAGPLGGAIVDPSGAATGKR
jgi:hypothetical protein